MEVKVAEGLFLRDFFLEQNIVKPHPLFSAKFDFS